MNSLILRRPSPPSFFSKHTVSHLTKLLLVLSEEVDHRKLLISLSMERQVLLGMGIAIKMWREIEERTCFTKVSLPVKERNTPEVLVDDINYSIHGRKLNGRKSGRNGLVVNQVIKP